MLYTHSDVNALARSCSDEACKRLAVRNGLARDAWWWLILAYLIGASMCDGDHGARRGHMSDCMPQRYLHRVRHCCGKKPEVAGELR